MTQKTPYQFFLVNAGYSVAAGETKLQGKRRCARLLANAEYRAADLDCTFTWEQDDRDSSEWSDERPPYALWLCVARRSDGSVFATLGGVDFGRDRDPWMDDYKRVVEAELACELGDAS